MPLLSEVWHLNCCDTYVYTHASVLFPGYTYKHNLIVLSSTLATSNVFCVFRQGHGYTEWLLNFAVSVL